jgi:hypothetical protein
MGMHKWNVAVLGMTAHSVLVTRVFPQCVKA